MKAILKYPGNRRISMNNTKIDWCDSTWNPITGCLYGCEYCYARGIAERFGGKQKFTNIFEEDEPLIGTDGKTVAYPHSFSPTFLKYHLDDYINKKGRNIFVCSMADLFGDWVPDNWIREVFAVCEKAPQHNYLFLTKNPRRYVELAEKGILKYLDNMWYGWTETSSGNRPGLMCFPGNSTNNLKTFVSVEPILGPIRPGLADWIIVGAETGKRKDKVIPEREWIRQIAEDCREYGIPLFMKSSLADIWGELLIQEFPEKLKNKNEVK